MTSCATTIPSGRGPEDIVVAEIGNESFLITATGSRPSWALPMAINGLGLGKGRLEILRKGANAFIPSEAAPAKDRFLPYGLSFVKKSEVTNQQYLGKSLLYTTHKAFGKGRWKRYPTAAVFEVGTTGLKYIDTLSPAYDLPGNFNSILAAPDGTVFATIFDACPFVKTRTPVVVDSESCKLAKDTLVSYDPSSGCWKVVVENLRGANGLAFSPDGSELLVCSYYEKKIYAFERDSEHPHRLVGAAREIFQPGFFPDNLSAGSDSQYFVAGQSNRLLTTLDFLFPGVPHPSGYATFSYPPKPDQFPAEYSADSRAVSVATPWEGDLYLGSINRKGVVRIPIPKI